MVWECFYVKSDSFEIAAWKKSLAQSLAEMYEATHL